MLPEVDASAPHGGRSVLVPPPPEVCKVRINKDLGLDFHFDGQLAESHQWVAGRNLNLYLQYIMPYKSLNG